jgi:hypothetical protein
MIATSEAARTDPAALESRYDGPIPPQVRAVARLGSPAMVLLVRARAEAAFFRAMVRGQVRTIRRRRADGSFYPALIDDLRLYLRYVRAWQHLAVRMAGAAAGPRRMPSTRSPANGGRGFDMMGHPIARSTIGPDSAVVR